MSQFLDTDLQFNFPQSNLYHVADEKRQQYDELLTKIGPCRPVLI